MTADNNQVGSVFASLHTDIADPVERLLAIKQSTAEAKVSGEASPMVDAMKLAGVFSPLVSKAVAGFWARNELSRFIPMNVSTCISNVAGPDFPLYCAGARMVDYYGLGVLTPGMGIFHLVFSYSGKVTLSVLADRDIMPDPELYHDFLVASYEEIYRAAVGDVAGNLDAVSPKRDTAARPEPGTRTDTAKPKARDKTRTKAKAGARVTPAARRLPRAAAGKKTPARKPQTRARPKNAAAPR
jgi:hypothetical protein